MGNKSKASKATELRAFKTHELFLVGFITVMLCICFLKGISILVVNFSEIMYVAIEYCLNHGISSVSENWLYLTLFEKTIVVVVPVLQIFFIIGAIKIGYKLMINIGQAVLSNQIFKNIF